MLIQSILDEEQKVLCWLRVRSHHYGLYIDVFADEPTKETSEHKAFARLDIDGFNNALHVLLGTEEQLLEGQILPTLLVEGDIASKQRGTR